MNRRRSASSTTTYACSWLRSGRLLIGTMPIRDEHWQALDRQGVNSVFSCCDPSEGAWQPPTHWQRVQLPLPDHRNPDDLDVSKLAQAVNTAWQLYRDSPALYLHCWAGMERSPLVAIGLLCKAEGLSIFDALAQVRALHPPARPITRHLVVLEEILMG
jgi:predicted protein tyrosine phosphatase